MEPNNDIKPDEIFQAVYEWAENQAMKNQNVENFNKNDVIKAEITPFLSNIEFKRMKPRFLTEYVVKRGFLFSYDELSNILGSIHFIHIHDDVKGNFVKCEEFLKADKSVYEWSENQAIVKNESNDKNINLYDAIKAEITPFLQFMKFKRMEPRFLTEYVVKRGFLFSYDELSNILGSIHDDVKGNFVVMLK
uniref:Uncharacterized protein n=1 Tax=Panagrolaimus davidi TaxID=227884 RepID=A0A914NZJ2_9BILA